MTKDAIARNRALVARLKGKKKPRHGKVIAFRPPPDLDPFVEQALLSGVTQADLLSEWGRAYYGQESSLDSNTSQ